MSLCLISSPPSQVLFVSLCSNKIPRNVVKMFCTSRGTSLFDALCYLFCHRMETWNTTEVLKEQISAGSTLRHRKLHHQFLCCSSLAVLFRESRCRGWVTLFKREKNHWRAAGMIEISICKKALHTSRFQKMWRSRRTLRRDNAPTQEK